MESSRNLFNNVLLCSSSVIVPYAGISSICFSNFFLEKNKRGKRSFFSFSSFVIPSKYITTSCYDTFCQMSSFLLRSFLFSFKIKMQNGVTNPLKLNCLIFPSKMETSKEWKKLEGGSKVGSPGF